jgi:hypothetical protein
MIITLKMNQRVRPLILCEGTDQPSFMPITEPGNGTNQPSLKPTMEPGNGTGLPTFTPTIKPGNGMLLYECQLDYDMQ